MHYWHGKRFKKKHEACKNRKEYGNEKVPPSPRETGCGGTFLYFLMVLNS